MDPLTAHICAGMAVNTSKIGGIRLPRDIGGILKKEILAMCSTDQVPPRIPQFWGDRPPVLSLKNEQKS